MISSPNTVLANSLIDALDIVRPRVEINQPKEIIFSVGTQINGIPHNWNLYRPVRQFYPGEKDTGEVQDSHQR